jgi:hypothetical protein
MNVPRIAALLAGIAFAATFGNAFGGVAFPQVSSSDSQQVDPSSLPAAGGPNRPANVPGEYVITPFGYFHPSCVRSLVKGERQMRDGSVQHADGTIEPVAACGYPHYMRGGIRTKAGNARTTTPNEGNTESTPSPTFSGWVESASINTGSPAQSYGGMIGTWTVPPQPAADDGQVLYFFLGFEDINHVESIIQPVLGWYQGHWTIASWNCCINGVVMNSPFVNVSSGDEIYGSVTSSCPAGTLSCATWNVLTLDMSTGESTTLGNTPSAGQVFNWAFGGVLEVYYVNTCDDYPSDGRLSFERIRVFDQNLHPVSDPKWSEATAPSTLQPQCGYEVEPARRIVTLEY